MTMIDSRATTAQSGAPALVSSAGDDLMAEFNAWDAASDEALINFERNMDGPAS